MPEITNKTKKTSKKQTVEVEEPPAEIKKESVKSKKTCRSKKDFTGSRK